jgi:hypothetical protein
MLKLRTRPAIKLSLLGALLWGAYVVSANLLLRGGWLESQIESWKDGYVKVVEIHSWFPGHIALQGFYIQHEDANVRWSATVDNVSAWVNPFGLLIRRADFRHIRGDVGRFRMRIKQASERRCLAPLPPRRKSEEKEDKPPDEPKWSFAFSGIRIREFPEIWVDCYRFTGNAEVKGGFTIGSGEWALVKSSALTLKEGSIERPAEGTFIESARGTLSASISRFPAEVTNAEFFNYVTANVDLKLSGASLDVMRLYTHSLPWINGRNSPAEIDISVGVVDGFLTDRSWATARADRAKLRLAAFQTVGDLAAKFSARGVPKLEIDLKNFSVVGREEALRAKALSLVLTGQTLRLYESASGLDYAIDLPHASILSLRDLNWYLPSAAKLEIADTKGSLSFKMKTATSGEKGHLKLKLRPLGLRHEGRLYSGRLNLDMPLESSSFEKLELRTPKSRLDLGLREVADPSKEAKGSVYLTAARMNFTERKYAGSVRADFPKSEVLQRYLIEVTSVPGWILGLMGGKGLGATAKLTANSERFLAEGLRLKTGSVLVQGDYCAAPQPHRKGAILVWAGPFAVGAAMNGPKSNLVLHEAQGWFDGFDSKASSCLTPNALTTTLAD